MFYLYEVLPDRTLCAARDAIGCHFQFANRDVAVSRATYEASIREYPVAVSSFGDLHGSRHVPEGVAFSNRVSARTIQEAYRKIGVYLDDTDAEREAAEIRAEQDRLLTTDMVTFFHTPVNGVQADVGFMTAVH